jgi:outer membrane protein TolC
MAGAERTRAVARAFAAVLGAALVAGCASLAPDAGLAPVAEAVQARLGATLQADRGDADAQAIRARVDELLAAPLSMDAAVQVALLNNRGLQARLAALGVSDAERVMASRLPNPGFSFGRMRSGDEREIERGLHLDLARLLMAPTIAELEARRHEGERHALTAAALALGHDTRKAWVRAVAAEETVRYMRRVMQAAEASAELARRMQQAGNFSPLQRAREQAFYADAALNLARAEAQQHATRERLVRLLGLWGTQTGFTLPERLPELPAEVAETPDLESRAVAGRLDVAAAKAAALRTASSLGLTRTTRFVNVLELGLVRNSSNEAPTTRGWEIELELPLFDWGDARVARAEAVYRQALHHAAEVAINARSEAREAHANWRAAHAIARHHFDEIVPLRRLVADENLLRYNGMLIGVFELLADARAQIASVNAAIEALRDFWVAQADLDMALIGPPRLDAPAGPSMSTDEAGGAGH